MYRTSFNLRREGMSTDSDYHQTRYKVKEAKSSTNKHKQKNILIDHESQSAIKDKIKIQDETVDASLLQTTIIHAQEKHKQ